jgi:hypothetical protein
MLLSEIYFVELEADVEVRLDINRQKETWTVRTKFTGNDEDIKNKLK